MKRASQPPSPPGGQFLVYQTQDGKLKIDVRFEGETVWLTQLRIAELFQTSVPNINSHIRNLFAEGDLEANSVIKNFLTTAESNNYATKAYNLDVIISVGYRVKSHRGAQFRMWATQRICEYIVKGFTMNDERLKNPDQPFDYFEELTRRIQDIRTSGRRFYQKITDIYATSVDYDPTQDISLLFFKTVQNKVHWAITGKTAAEIVHERVDAETSKMGLTNWRGAVIRKPDVGIAKSYLIQAKRVWYCAHRQRSRRAGQMLARPRIHAHATPHEPGGTPARPTFAEHRRPRASRLFAVANATNEGLLV